MGILSNPCFPGKTNAFQRKHFSFRKASFTRNEKITLVSFRKNAQKMENAPVEKIGIYKKPASRLDEKQALRGMFELEAHIRRCAQAGTPYGSSLGA